MKNAFASISGFAMVALLQNSEFWRTRKRVVREKRTSCCQRLTVG